MSEQKTAIATRQVDADEAPRSPSRDAGATGAAPTTVGGPSAELGSVERGVGDSDPPSSGTGRWWAVVAVTSLLSMPVGWLLSYAAQLPFYLGLFFFALFGLLVGASAYRASARSRPLPGGSVLVGTTIIIAACWGTSIVVECLDFPESMSVKAVAAARSLDGKSVAEFRSSVEESAREMMRAQPGGPILGYIRWVVVDGNIEAKTIPGVNRSIRPVHRRQGWVIRVLVSIGLLAFGVASQTLPLRTARAGSAPLATDPEA